MPKCKICGKQLKLMEHHTCRRRADRIKGQVKMIDFLKK